MKEKYHTVKYIFDCVEFNIEFHNFSTRFSTQIKGVLQQFTVWWAFFLVGDLPLYHHYFLKKKSLHVIVFLTTNYGMQERLDDKKSLDSSRVNGHPKY